jgi:predicted DCC family thiol-disulfide oxidoreductase YuxK
MGSLGTLNPDQNVILFDGICNLCNGFVQFIIKRDKKNIFRFASLQSDYGQKQLQKIGVDADSMQTIVLVQSHQVLRRSDAVLEIAKRLPGSWPLLYGLKIIPRFIRDFVYWLIAKNRYRIFGKKKECWIPTPELSRWFLK